MAKDELGNTESETDTENAGNENTVLGKKDNIDREYDGGEDDVAVEDSEESSMSTAGVLGVVSATVGSGKSLADGGLNFAEVTGASDEGDTARAAEATEASEAAAVAAATLKSAEALVAADATTQASQREERTENTREERGGAREASGQNNQQDGATTQGNTGVAAGSGTATVMSFVGAAPAAGGGIAAAAASLATPAASAAAEAKASAMTAAGEAAAAKAEAAASKASEAAAAETAAPAPAPAVFDTAAAFEAPAPILQAPVFRPANANDVFEAFSNGIIDKARAITLLQEFSRSGLSSSTADRLLAFAGDDVAKADFATRTFISPSSGSIPDGATINTFLNLAGSSALSSQSPQALWSFTTEVGSLNFASKRLLLQKVQTGAISFTNAEQIIDYAPSLTDRIVTLTNSNADVSKIIGFKTSTAISDNLMVSVLNSGQWQGITDAVNNKALSTGSLTLVTQQSVATISNLLTFANGLGNAVLVDQVLATSVWPSIITDSFFTDAGKVTQLLSLINSTAIPASDAVLVADMKALYGEFTPTTAQLIITRLANGSIDYALADDLVRVVDDGKISEAGLVALLNNNPTGFTQSVLDAALNNTGGTGGGGTVGTSITNTAAFIADPANAAAVAAATSITVTDNPALNRLAAHYNTDRISAEELTSIVKLHIDGRLDDAAVDSLNQLIGDTTEQANGLVVMVERLYDMGLSQATIDTFIDKMASGILSPDAMCGIINATKDGVNSETVGGTMGYTYTVDGVLSLGAVETLAAQLKEGNIQPSEISALINHAKSNMPLDVAFVNLVLENISDTSGDLPISKFTTIMTSGLMPQDKLRMAQILVADPSIEPSDFFSAPPALLSLLINDKISLAAFDIVRDLAPASQTDFINAYSNYQNTTGAINDLLVMTTPEIAIDIVRKFSLLTPQLTANEFILLVQKLDGNDEALETLHGASISDEIKNQLLKDFANGGISSGQFADLAELADENSSLLTSIVPPAPGNYDYAKIMPLVALGLEDSALAAQVNSLPPLMNKDLIAHLMGEVLENGSITDATGKINQIMTAFNNGAITGEANLIKALYLLNECGTPSLSDADINLDYDGLVLGAQTQLNGIYGAIQPTLFAMLNDGRLLPDAVAYVANLALDNASRQGILNDVVGGHLNYAALDALKDVNASGNLVHQLALKNFTSENVLALVDTLLSTTGTALDSNLTDMLIDLMARNGAFSPEGYISIAEDLSETDLVPSQHIRLLNGFPILDAWHASIYTKTIDAIAHEGLDTDKAIDLATGNKDMLGKIVNRLADGRLDVAVVNECGCFDANFINKLGINPSEGDMFLNALGIYSNTHNMAGELNDFIHLINTGMPVSIGTSLLNAVNNGQLFNENFMDIVADYNPANAGAVDKLLQGLNYNALDAFGVDALLTAADSSEVHDATLNTLFDSLDGFSNSNETLINAATAVDILALDDADLASGIIGALNTGVMTAEAAENLLALHDRGDIDDDALGMILSRYAAEHHDINYALNLLDGASDGAGGYCHDASTLQGLLNTWLPTNTYTIGRLDLDNAENGVLPDPTEGLVAGLGGLTLPDNDPPPPQI